MADSPARPEPLDSRDPPEDEGIRLSKEQRKELLAEIERQLSRRESPQRVLQRAEQALAERNLDQARRLVKQLESIAPQMAALPILRQKLDNVETAEKRKGNLAKAEEMLRRYIQQRKKPLAEMALETLVEIAPSHPRRGEYELWVADLDKELELQQQVDTELAAGRAALLTDDVARARKHAAILRKLDPTAGAAETLDREIATAEQGRAENADIERLKSKAEELIREQRFEDAGREVERLALLDVPKLTIDFLRKHLEEARQEAYARTEAESLISAFHDQVASRHWQGARDVAHRFGQRFPDRPEGPQLFNRVTELEAAERRQQSLEQGVRTLEQLIAEGKRSQAELALKLLCRLELDEERLARFTEIVARL